MKNNFLIFSSKHNIEALLDFFLALSSKNKLFFLGSSKNLQNISKENHWKHIKFSIPYPRNLFFGLIFLFLFPFKIFISFLFLLFFKQKKQINHIIFFSVPELLIFAWPAKILKIKTLFFVLPEQENKGKILSFLLKNLSKNTKIFNFRKNDFLKGKLINLGINPQRHRRQENIFNSMADAQKNKKFFSIGVIYNSKNITYLETLLKASKEIYATIPNIQILIIGKKENKNKAEWIAKKLNTNTYTWFIQKPKILNKWLQNIDIFFNGKDISNLNDLYYLIQVLNSNAVLLSTEIKNIDHILQNKKNCLLLDDLNQENLSQAILKLQKNKKFRENLTQNAKEYVDKNHQLDTMLNLCEL